MINKPSAHASRQQTLNPRAANAISFIIVQKNLVFKNEFTRHQLGQKSVAVLLGLCHNPQRKYYFEKKFCLRIKNFKVAQNAIAKHVTYVHEAPVAVFIYENGRFDCSPELQFQNYGNIDTFFCHKKESSFKILSFQGLTTFSAIYYNDPHYGEFGTTLKHFECENFNQPIGSFENLETFVCRSFNHPVANFGKLKHFKCSFFNQPVQSFDSLTNFECGKFNRQVTDFGQLSEFTCYNFNQPVANFGQLHKFDAYRFNQPVHSFGTLKIFFSFAFDHPLPENDGFGQNLQVFWTGRFDHYVKSFANLVVFVSDCFNHPVANFGQLEVFRGASFDMPIVTNFDNLVHFASTMFNQKIDNFGKLAHFHSGHFNQPIQSFNNLRHFECAAFDQPLPAEKFGKLEVFRCISFEQPVADCDTKNLKRIKTASEDWVKKQIF